VFCVLLVARGEDRVADRQPVGFEVVAVEIRGERDEDVDVAVACEPRVPRGRADLEDLRLDGQVGHSLACAASQVGHGRVEAVAFGGVGGGPLADGFGNGVEGVGHDEVLPTSA